MLLLLLLYIPCWIRSSTILSRITYCTINKIIKNNEKIIKQQYDEQKINEKVFIEKIKSKYETKIKLIETKLNELLQQKFNSDKSDAIEMANEFTKKIKIEIENKYSAKIQE